MERIYTDVLVIGSGFGAAPAALRFAQAGLDVTVVEQGPAIDPFKDFKQTQDPKYLLRYLKGLNGPNLSMTYAQALGGGSGFYEMVSLRAPSIAFNQADSAGHRLWPRSIDRATLDPFYDVAERMLKVEQIDPNQIPKTGLVFSQMMKNLGYTCERARYAVRGCVGSGRCVTGCIYGAKQSLLLNYLPEAVAAGATFETATEALWIANRPSPSRGGQISDIPYLYEVHCRRSETGAHLRFRSKIVVLAGGTVGTAKLLLASRKHLQSLSAHVGNNIAFNGGVKTAGILGDQLPDGDMYTGRSHPGMISYEFLESRGISISAGKPLPLQAVASARLRLDGDDPFWGQRHVELMKQYRHRVIVLVAFGMTPPTGSMRIREKGDIEVDLELTPELRNYYRVTKALLHSIMERNGCRPLTVDFVDKQGMPHRDLHFATTHQVGSCRMADSRADGVCDASGEVFGYPGLFITDGAAVPTSLAVNTSLTILANAERIVARILERLRPSAVAA